ncbi:MAG: hypoxanthine phosphoribosyltransferase [Kiloniellales bacterium]
MNHTETVAATSVRKLFDETEIARRVAELAREVAEAMPPDLVLVGILKGSFVFMGDLIRALDREGIAPRVEFMRLASYGHGRESSRAVRLLGEVPEEIKGRQVLLVDDILDTGHTLAHAKALLTRSGAKRVLTLALVDKPSRREIDLAADLVGFTVGDLFVVGYGIDYAEKYRHLPYIGTID